MTNQLPRDRSLRQQFLRLVFGGTLGTVVLIAIGISLWVYWRYLARRSIVPPFGIAGRCRPTLRQ